MRLTLPLPLRPMTVQWRMEDTMWPMHGCKLGQHRWMRISSPKLQLWQLVPGRVTDRLWMLLHLRLLC